jgi:hypothetical protein
VGLPYGLRELPTWGNWFPRWPNINLDVEMGRRSIGDAANLLVVRAAFFIERSLGCNCAEIEIDRRG